MDWYRKIEALLPPSATLLPEYLRNLDIKRTQANADLSIISQTAREKLQSALQSLRDEVDIMLTLIKEEK